MRRSRHETAVQAVIFVRLGSVRRSKWLSIHEASPFVRNCFLGLKSETLGPKSNHTIGRFSRHRIESYRINLARKHTGEGKRLRCWGRQFSDSTNLIQLKLLIQVHYRRNGCSAKANKVNNELCAILGRT